MDVVFYRVSSPCSVASPAVKMSYCNLGGCCYYHYTHLHNVHAHGSMLMICILNKVAVDHARHLSLLYTVINSFKVMLSNCICIIMHVYVCSSSEIFSFIFFLW